MKLKYNGHLWFIELIFEPRDIWIGVYSDRNPFPGGWDPTDLLDVYVCLIPMFPIHYRGEVAPRRAKGQSTNG